MNRNSNIELLRIILITFVIILHFNNESMGGAFLLSKDLPLTNSIFHFFESFSCCAVNCFMIISGYFLYTNTKVKFSKIFDILAIVVFYRLFNYFLTLVFLKNIFSLKSFINCFLPANYFAIFYVISYIFSPFIAKLFRELSFSSANHLIILLISIFIIFTSLLDISIYLGIFPNKSYLSPISILGNGDGYTIIQFIVMLCLGMWFRKTEFSLSTNILFIMYLSSSCIIWILSRFLPVYNYNFILNTFSSACLFLLFNNFTFHSNLINFLSKSVFGIFCIHTSFFFNYLWKKFFITSLHIQNDFYISIFWMLISIISMFLISILISIIIRGLFYKIRYFIENKLSIIDIK